MIRPGFLSRSMKSESAGERTRTMPSLRASVTVAPGPSAMALKSLLEMVEPHRAETMPPNEPSGLARRRLNGITIRPVIRRRRGWR